MLLLPYNPKFKNTTENRNGLHRERAAYQVLAILISSVCQSYVIVNNFAVFETWFLPAESYVEYRGGFVGEYVTQIACFCFNTAGF